MPDSALPAGVQFEKVAFIGLGLIGSSLARVIRAQGLARQIVASTRSQSTLAEALRLGVIDQGFADPADAARDADLIVLAMPVQATEAMLRAIAPVMRADAVITDVGSTKGNVVAAAHAVFGATLPSGFVPAHPIAGAEKSGVALAVMEAEGFDALIALQGMGQAGGGILPAREQDESGGMHGRYGKPAAPGIGLALACCC